MAPRRLGFLCGNWEQGAKQDGCRHVHEKLVLFLTLIHTNGLQKTSFFSKLLSLSKTSARWCSRCKAAGRRRLQKLH